jgi:hypothetical protein
MLRSSMGGSERAGDGDARWRGSPDLLKIELPSTEFDGNNFKTKIKTLRTHLDAWDGEWRGEEGDRAAELRRAAGTPLFNSESALCERGGQMRCEENGLGIHLL